MFYLEETINYLGVNLWSEKNSLSGLSLVPKSPQALIAPVGAGKGTVTNIFWGFIKAALPYRCYVEVHFIKSFSEDTGFKPKSIRGKDIVRLQLRIHGEERESRNGRKDGALELILEPELSKEAWRYRAGRFDLKSHTEILPTSHAMILGSLGTTKHWIERVIIWGVWVVTLGKYNSKEYHSSSRITLILYRNLY